MGVVLGFVLGVVLCFGCCEVAVLGGVLRVVFSVGSGVVLDDVQRVSSVVGVVSGVV